MAEPVAILRAGNDELSDLVAGLRGWAEEDFLLHELFLLACHIRMMQVEFGWLKYKGTAWMLWQSLWLE